MFTFIAAQHLGFMKHNMDLITSWCLGDMMVSFAHKTIMTLHLMSHCQTFVWGQLKEFIVLFSKDTLNCVKSESKDINNVDFKQILFHKNIKQHNCFQH